MPRWCTDSLNVPCRGTSNEWSKQMFSWRNSKNIWTHPLIWSQVTLFVQRIILVSKCILCVPNGIVSVVTAVSIHRISFDAKIAKKCLLIIFIHVDLWIYDVFRNVSLTFTLFCHTQQKTNWWYFSYFSNKDMKCQSCFLGKIRKKWRQFA